MNWIYQIIFAAALGLTGGQVFAADKNTCTAKDLARRDCRLILGTVNVRLLPQSVAWYDGTWHTVEEMPLKDQQSDWEKVDLHTLGGRLILQMWIWDKGVETSKVQSQHWLVTELQNRKFKILADGTVRKRRPKAQDGLKAAEPVKFLYDSVIEHSLKPAKNGDLEWTLGIDKKTLTRTEDGV